MSSHWQSATNNWWPRLMHYCFLSAGTWVNASFVRLREFGHELSKRGHAVSYIVDDMPENQRDLRLPANATIEWVPRGTKSEMPERRRKLKKLAPDYVHVLNPYAKAFLALAGTRQRVVGDWDEWPAGWPLPFARKMLARFLDHWLRSRGNPLIVCSRHLQQEFKRRFGIDAAYIPYATYLEPNPDGESPFSEPTAVYVGNFVAAYDHDVIIEAADLLRQRGQRIAMRLLGQGPDLEKWRRFAADKKLDNVEFMGYVTGDLLWRHLRHAHVLLFPIREKMSNLCRCPSKTFAYMQAKRPIITNRVGEVAEALGNRARYVECSPAEFAQAIEEVLKPGVSPPDIDYHVEEHSWALRATQLLETIEGKGEHA